VPAAAHRALSPWRALPQDRTRGSS
jgi:hypothetical protein